jgi:hypothetical protein
MTGSMYKARTSYVIAMLLVGCSSNTGARTVPSEPSIRGIVRDSPAPLDAVAKTVNVDSSRQYLIRDAATLARDLRSNADTLEGLLDYPIVVLRTDDASLSTVCDQRARAELASYTQLLQDPNREVPRCGQSSVGITCAQFGRSREAGVLMEFRRRERWYLAMVVVGSVHAIDARIQALLDQAEARVAEPTCD